MGFTNFYQQFIKKFNQIEALLNSILKILIKKLIDLFIK